MARRAISGPAAAVIFLAVGAALLLSTSYISDLFGSISFERRIASKLLMARPQQLGQEVMSLVEDAFDQAAHQAVLDSGKSGAGRAVWYCNTPQPPTVSEVRASLCESTYTRAEYYVQERLAEYNYSVELPNCIYLNTTNPDFLVIIAQGQSVTGPGVGSIGSTTVNVSTRFWTLYNNMTGWVNGGMGGMFSELCKINSRACQVRECSCDSSVISESKGVIIDKLSLKESEIQEVVDQVLQDFTSSLGSGVECTSKLHIVTKNSEETSNRTTMGCNCELNVPSTCSIEDPYLDDPTGTTELNECNSTEPCLVCDDDDCRSVLPASSCGAPKRLDITTIGTPNLITLSHTLGHHIEHFDDWNTQVFDADVAITDADVKQHQIDSMLNFVNGRALIIHPDGYVSLRSQIHSPETNFSSKGIQSSYFKVGQGIVVELNPTWEVLSPVDQKLLTAHYYDLITQELHEPVDFNCTSLIPQALASVIVDYPANGTELLVSMDRKAYVYGTINCQDTRYLINDQHLNFAFDFWISMEKECPHPPTCNGTSDNCQAAMTLDLPQQPAECPQCFEFAELEDVSIRKTEGGSVKCKHFSGPKMICEFLYGSGSVLSPLQPENKKFAVSCSCYINNIPTDCEQVVNTNSTSTIKPSVRCPVAFPAGTFHPSYLGTANCGTIYEKFGFNITGQVCDLQCYMKSADETACGDCRPQFDDECGCGSCSFQLNTTTEQYWVGEGSILFANGTTASSSNPTVDTNIIDHTCTSLIPRVSCSGNLDLEDSTSLLSGIYGNTDEILANLCLTPITLRSHSSFLDVCGCAQQATDPELADDAIRFSDVNYTSRLLADSGFMECCQTCLLARTCAMNEQEHCRLGGKSCQDWLVGSGGNKQSPDWQNFLDCCDDHCLEPCTACMCPENSEGPFCDQPICGTVWEISCTPLTQNPTHSSCMQPECTSFSGSGCSYLGDSVDPGRGCGVIACQPYEIQTSCGASGDCGSCTSESLYEVSGIYSPYIDMTGFCDLSPTPTLAEACGAELGSGKHLACVKTSCDYSVGDFLCKSADAGLPCSLGLSGQICRQCDGTGQCTANSSAEGLPCVPVVHDKYWGNKCSWDYSVAEPGCCCVDEYCTQKTDCSSDGTCDLDCQGYDPDCQPVYDQTKECEECNFCSSGSCVPNPPAQCGAGCNVQIQTISGIEVGVCVCS